MTVHIAKQNRKGIIIFVKNAKQLLNGSWPAGSRQLANKSLKYARLSASQVISSPLSYLAINSTWLYYGEACFGQVIHPRCLNAAPPPQADASYPPQHRGWSHYEPARTYRTGRAKHPWRLSIMIHSTPPPLCSPALSRTHHGFALSTSSRMRWRRLFAYPPRLPSTSSTTTDSGFPIGRGARPRLQLKCFSQGLSVRFRHLTYSSNATLKIPFNARAIGSTRT